MLTRWISLLVTLSLVVIACSPGGGAGDGDAGPGGVAGDGTGTDAADPGMSDDGATADLVVDLAGDDDDAAAVGRAVNAFGFDLLGQVTDGTQTAITSPLSVATLLAMVLAGAGGDTAQAMADVLHLDDARDVRVGALLDRLVDTDDVTISVANGLWTDDGTPFEPDYLDFTRRIFDATVEETDLGAQETADAIDAWVGEHTNDLIDAIARDLGLPDSQAVLVLVNAVYFLGEWTTQFDPALTRPEPFTLPDGAEVDVPMMRLSGQYFGHAEGEGYRMLRLPYGESGRYGMEVLLPDGDLPALLQDLDAEEWGATVDRLEHTEVDEVALPSFELEWQAQLNDPLIELGMGVAFGPDADLSPMSPVAPWLDTVVHKTYIRVDEEGTEAAAVTGGVVATSAGPDPVIFQVDRPFAFTISDAETGTILFLGTVTDPRG